MEGVEHVERVGLDSWAGRPLPRGLPDRAERRSWPARPTCSPAVLTFPWVGMGSGRKPH